MLNNKTTTARGLLGFMCMILSFTMAVDSQFSDFDHISEVEFMTLYRSQIKWTDEIELVKKAFPHEESQVDPNTYSELLSTCLLTNYGLSDSKDSDFEELGKTLRIHVKEYVMKNRAHRSLNLKDVYEDLFLGHLRQWLITYDSDSDSTTSHQPQGSVESSDTNHEDL